MNISKKLHKDPEAEEYGNIAKIRKNPKMVSFKGDCKLHQNSQINNDKSSNHTRREMVKFEDKSITTEPQEDVITPIASAKVKLRPTMLYDPSKITTLKPYVTAGCEISPKIPQKYVQPQQTLPDIETVLARITHSQRTICTALDSLV